MSRQVWRDSAGEYQADEPLDLGLLTSRTEREHISSALGLQVCDAFLQ